MKILRLTFQVLSLWFVTGHILAQSPAATPGQTTLSARFYCLSVTGAEIPDLAIISKKQTTPLKIPADYLGSLVLYTGPAKMSVYSTQSAALALRPEAVVAMPGGTVPAPVPTVATVDLPAGGGDFLLLFGGEPGALKIITLDFSEKAIPRGAYAFWNLSANQLGVMLGGARVVIPSRSQQTVTLSAPDNSYVPFNIFREGGEGVKQVFGSRHLHMAAARQLVFLYPVTDSSDVRVKMITQRVFAPPAAPITAKPVSTAGR